MASCQSRVRRRDAHRGLNENASCDEHGGIAGVSDTPPAPATTIPPSTTSAGAPTTVSAATTAPSTTIADPAPTTPAPTIPPTTAGVPAAAVTNVLPIEVGSTGPAVAAVQARIGVGVDCDFGNQTSEAVENWQREHGLPVTGSITATDWTALEVPGLWGNDTNGNGQIDETEEITLACDGEVELPVWPEVSPAALAFIDADECHVFETNESGDIEWFECTRVEPSDGEIAVIYITPNSDPVAALAWAQALPEYNEFAAVLFYIEGGGVLYQHSGVWEMFDVAPWPDLSVVDTDCAPFPEPNPDLCPTSTPVVQSSAAVPAEYQNALQTAESYLDFIAFSQQGLIEQLEYEQYSTEAAQWAVENVDVDWNEQAALKAAEYLDFQAFSEGGLRDQLEYEGFTPEQIDFAIAEMKAQGRL